MTAVVLGTEDMSVKEYGASPRPHRPQSRDAVPSRGRCILAARLAGIDCIDAPHFYYRDLDGTKLAADWAARLGFTGKTCLSPRQVAAVNQAFAPTPDDIAWARRVLDALEEAKAKDLSVAVTDGMMVDAPHARQAQLILQRAGEADAEQNAVPGPDRGRSGHDAPGRRFDAQDRIQRGPRHSRGPGTPVVRAADLATAAANFGFMYRLGREQSFQAIAEAGYDPVELSAVSAAISTSPSSSHAETGAPSRPSSSATTSTACRSIRSN